MDGNESYSSLVHASNLFQFGIDRSMGLTDESASPDSEAHPFLHTHQGNFPRLFASLIFFLGAQSIESQIIITTFTVGLVAIFFVFTFFSRITGPFFALLVSTVFMSDYILFTQWQVNTYRVWHVFFVFSSLLCAQGIGGSRSRVWLIVTFVNFACLFYWELVFATFVAVATSLYTCWIHRKTWTLVLLGWGIQITGAITGLSVLCLQLIAFLGWDDFLQDISLTFTARNHAKADPNWIDTLRQFYDSHNIAFFYNLQSAENLAGLETLLRSIFTYVFQVHTPFLSFSVLVVAIGWALGNSLALLQGNRFINTASRTNTRAGALWSGTPGLILLATTMSFFLYCLIFKGFSLDGTIAETPSLFGPDHSFLGSTILLILIGYCAFFLIQHSQITSTLISSSRFARIFVASLYLVGASIFLLYQNHLYDQRLFIPGLGNLGFSSPLMASLISIITVSIGLLLIILGPKLFMHHGGVELKGLFPFFLTGLCSFLFVNMLSPGYMFSGYLSRYSPLLVFHIDTLMAVFLYMLLSVGSAAYFKMKMAWSIRHISFAKAWGTRQGVVAIGALSMTAFFFIYWGNLQLRYIHLFPHDQFTFMKQLRQPPFKGESFTVNNYPIPTYTFTRQWAYNSPYTGKMTLTASGYQREPDLQYLWFADRHTNNEYLKPKYYLCMRTQTMQSVASFVKSHQKKMSNCSNEYLVKYANSKKQFMLQHEVIAQDMSPLDNWAIVKFDWEFPPFLKPLNDNNDEKNIVVANIKQSSEGKTVTIHYNYDQQDNLPERNTITKIYGLKSRGNQQTSARTWDRWLIKKGVQQREFLLPPNYQGYIQASVIPTSETKMGSEYFSKIVLVDLQSQR